MQFLVVQKLKDRCANPFLAAKFLSKILLFLTDSMLNNGWFFYALHFSYMRLSYVSFPFNRRGFNLKKQQLRSSPRVCFYISYFFLPPNHSLRSNRQQQQGRRQLIGRTKLGTRLSNITKTLLPLAPPRCKFE